jgi:uncharacterized RDD family membrane protein YckC
MTTQTWRGKSFDAPKDGEGSVATLNARVGAFIVDAALAALLAWAFTAPEAPRNWSLVTWGVITLIGVSAFGVTPGHLVAGIRVATLRPASASPRVGLWGIPRTILVALLVPPLILDADGRGLHDRLCRTVVVRTR